MGTMSNSKYLYICVACCEVVLLVRQNYLFILLVIVLSCGIKTVQACENDCVYENSWALGLAVGIGDFSNPLHDGADRNIAVLPSFYFYSERFYIENTEIGYVIEENENWLVKVKGNFNNDGLYFNETKFDGLIISGLLGPGWFEEPDESVSANEVERKYSYMAGIGADYFVNDNIMLSAGVYHDVTNVHNGYSMNTSAQYILQRGDWRFQLGIGAEFKDSDLTNYYYGLREEDGTSYASFKVDSNINLSASTSLAYRITDNFYLTGRYYHEWLGSSMTVSPLVEDDYTRFFFIGITGQFGSH